MTRGVFDPGNYTAGRYPSGPGKARQDVTDALTVYRVLEQAASMSAATTGPGEPLSGDATAKRDALALAAAELAAAITRYLTEPSRIPIRTRETTGIRASEVAGRIADEIQREQKEYDC